MTDVQFGHEWVLAGLIVPPAILLVWWWGMRRGTLRARAVSRGALARPPYVAAVLFMLAAMAAVVAAALPQWGTRETRVPRNGADLIIVLDISRSMDARDVAPTRLEAAKAALTQTLARLGGDRVGLVVFAGSARLRFPLTTDLAAAAQVIQSLESGTVLVRGGTDASLGLDIALDAFKDDDASGRAVVLITDGDDLGTDPAATAARFKQERIDLMVAGIGSAGGGTVPVLDPRTQSTSDKLDASGQPIVTKLNEPFLRALAVAAGGRYIGSDPGVIAGAVSGRLQALKSAQIDSRPTDLPVERYQWFAGIALALLVLGSVAEWLGRLRGRMVLAGAMVLPLLLLAGCASAAYDANEEGRDALKAGDAARAIDKFSEAQAAHPGDTRLSLNLAAAYHAAGRYDEATLAARRVTGSPALSDRAKAFASVGHHEFAAGRLDAALEAFHRSLLEDPNNDVVRHDYEVVRKLLLPESTSDESPPGSPASGTPAPDGGQNGQPNGTPPAGSSQSPVTGGGGTRPSTPNPGGSVSPGQPPQRSAQDIERELRRIDEQVARLVQEAGDTPTAAQAMEILRLLAERSRIASLRDDGASGNPRDY